MAQGVVEGFGQNMSKLKYNTPNFTILNNLTYNVGVFAAFKNHDNIKELVKLLKDDDGQLRSKSDFLKEALKLNNKYNKQYLLTEYNQAVTSARMAKKWQNIKRTQHLYPNLRYVAVMDDRTRASHRKWHGIILPIDHPFWKTHYPPNDYGCRCDAKRTDKPIDTKGVDVDTIPDLPKQFNINVGMEGKVFSEEHPYFKTPEYTKVAKFAKVALLRYQTKKYYKDLKDTFPVPLKSEIGLIHVNNRGISEALSQPHKDGYLKNNLLLKLKEVLKNAFYIGSADSHKPNDYYKKYHYLRVKDYDSMIVVLKEDPKGAYFFHSIVDKTKL